MSNWFLRFLNRFFFRLTGLALAICILYAGYALWDNQQIYTYAENVAQDFRSMMPDTESESADSDTSEDNEANNYSNGQNKGAYAETFIKWQAINPDINGWITMDGTAIDYPIVQGRTNIDYISTNVYGEFSISGSIFLDSRNEFSYKDVYNLLYGHNMDAHGMFSDVNLYKEERFFNENKTGMLFLPEADHSLLTISIIVTDSGDSVIFNPNPWKNFSMEQMMEAVQKNALYINEAGLAAMQKKIEMGAIPQILALSTCSNEFTEARTILLTLMDPDVVPEAER